MTSDDVISQRRRGFLRINDLPVRNQSELDERLEAVADACHQSASAVEQFHRRLFYARIAEKCGDEFAGAVRLVSAGKAAGNEDDLRFSDFPCKILRRTGNARRRQVVDDHKLRLCTGIGKRFRAVVFTVCTREYGNQHARLCRPHGRGGLNACLICECRNLAVLRRNVARINRFQYGFIGTEQIAERKIAAVIGNDLLGYRLAERSSDIDSLGKLEDKRTVAVSKKLFHRPRTVIRKADSVSEAHFHDGLRHAAVGRRIGGKHLSLSHESRHRIEILKKRGRHRQSVLIVFGTQPYDLMSGALKLTGKDMLRLFHRHGEGYKRRRNVDFLEGTAHGILSADRRRAKLHLRFECAEQSGERFAPAAAVAHGFFKIFLEGQIDVLEFRTRRNQL